MSSVAILALLLPFVSLAVISRAVAQVQVLPTVAVVEFKDLRTPGSHNGALAQEAVQSELAKTNQYAVSASDTVIRAEQTLGLSSPPQSVTNLLRVGQEMRVGSIMSGDIVGVRIDNSGGGKLARVAMRMLVYD